MSLNSCRFKGVTKVSLLPNGIFLEGASLHKFLAGEQAFVRTEEHWHPRQEDAVAQVAEVMELPVHIADQLYAQMLESMKISEPIDEDSPWRALDDAK